MISLARSLLNLFVLCIFAIVPIAAYSADNDPFAEKDAPVAANEFLRFHEAYRLSPRLEGDRIYFDWTITDTYYLYTREFAIEALNASSRELLEISIPPGLQKFDEVFQEERELHYNSVSVSAPVPNWEGAYYLLHTVQGCADAGLCYPPETTAFKVENGLVLPVEMSEVQNLSAAPTDNLSSGAASSPPAEQPFLLWVLIGAFLGGIILNLMPCVFPVLSLKALSLAASDASTSKRILLGWAYTAGIAVSFVSVAVFIIFAKQAGDSIGWGFQLQEPVFVALLAYLFFVMGLSLVGMFELGGSWMGAGQSLVQGHGVSSSFFTGVLAAVVASPCTAPFMASAIGFAVTQSGIVSVSVFLALALGMAFPFLLLSYSPAVARWMPKPGAWMDTLKQALSFPLFLTCAWLLLVVGTQTSSDGSAYLVAGAAFLALFIWLLKLSPTSTAAKIFTKGLAFGSLVIALWIAIQIKEFSERDTGLWQPYSPDTLRELRSDGEAVFIDLTADWCITCKVNERVAINTDAVREFAQSNDIVMMQGDWTKKDPQITELLEQFQRSGVPLYLMYPAQANAEPAILPQLLTESLVLEAMAEAVK